MKLSYYVIPYIVVGLISLLSSCSNHSQDNQTKEKVYFDISEEIPSILDVVPGKTFVETSKLLDARNRTDEHFYNFQIKKYPTKKVINSSYIFSDIIFGTEADIRGDTVYYVETHFISKEFHESYYRALESGLEKVLCNKYGTPAKYQEIYYSSDNEVIYYSIWTSNNFGIKLICTIYSDHFAIDVRCSKLTDEFWDYL